MNTTIETTVHDHSPRSLRFLVSFPVLTLMLFQFMACDPPKFDFRQDSWKGVWGSDGPMMTGDLNGDHKTDVFMWRSGSNDWTINLSTGYGFQTQRWDGAWGSDGAINTGDLNGDGMTDVFMWNESLKVWTINLSTGSGFIVNAWGGAWGSDGPIYSGDLNGDGKTDIFYAERKSKRVGR